jgi:hypothetical protein
MVGTPGLEANKKVAGAPEETPGHRLPVKGLKPVPFLGFLPSPRLPL